MAVKSTWSISPPNGSVFELPVGVRVALAARSLR